MINNDSETVNLENDLYLNFVFISGDGQES